MLGFGFNKAKVLSSAEKYVQQGKLQNAIAEYLKIVKVEPRDLTVLNTIGDLYARLGNGGEASTYFKKVAEAYAGDGFTVKAIAMYKKLTKVAPSETDCLLKLAELYSQQGLYNDARSQYVQVADQFIKGGKLEQAAQIFQKMLEFDPENTTMQAKLAEVCMKLGKKEDAREIFYRSAESLYQRGSLEGAEDALGRVLNMDPNHGPALLLRGKIALDAGNGALAVESFNKVPDIDSRPDGLRSLLRAHALLGQVDELEPIAKKVLAVHNDISGFGAYADALMGRGEFEKAFKLYLEYADRFLAGNPTAFLNTLHNTISRVKDNSTCLELLREFFEKSGDRTHLSELSELLAHAYVQQGRLADARDLYKQLTDLEPENPLHAQSYRQMVAKIGEDVTTRPLTAEEGSQPLMAEEMEQPAAAAPEALYSEEVAEAIRAALTEAELYESYKAPAKAIAPLEAVLPRAPRDVEVNQRLVALYVRAARFADAARCCSLLQSIHSDAGQQAEARQYAELAKKYRQSAGIAEPPAEAVAAPPVEALAAPPPKPAPPVTYEIDLSDEWESAAATPASPEPAVTSFDDLPVAVEEADTVAPAAPVAPELAVPGLADTVAEIEFYLSNSMWNEARAAIANCEALAPSFARLPEFRSQLPATAPAPEVLTEAPPAAQPAEVAVAQPQAPPTELVVEAVEEATVTDFVFESTGEAEVAVAPAPVAAIEEAPAAVHEVVVEQEQPAPLEPETPPAPPVVEPEPAPVPSLAAAPKTPVAPPAAGEEEDILGSFVLDLESSLGDDFSLDAPPPPPSAPPPAVPARPASAAAPPQVPAAAKPAAAVAAPAAPVVAPPAMAAAAAASAQATAAPPPSPAPGLSATAVRETTSALSDLFDEFKQDVEEGTPEVEDPETHYNLGVAFKEMGLLDEAIGELQKVCEAVDRGQSFGQVMEAYTWLAHCFVEKGVAEAAVRWYEKALKLPTIDREASTAIHYELACAHETGGNAKAALAHFMEVYGVNIDYRDVAERIKALKS
jgi:tetratricopeptide (TPR) repeat protein